MMVSTDSPRIARACSSNCESRCERSVTRPLSYGRGRTLSKYTSSPRTSSSTPNTPRPPSELTMRAAIDFAASSAAGDICCGCQDSSTSPSAVAVTDRLAEVDGGTGRPDGTDGEQGDLEVDFDDRLGHHPVVGDPASGDGTVPRRLDVVDTQQHRLAITGCRGGRLDHQREAGVLRDGGQLLGGPGEPERRGGQAQFVGRQSPQTLPVDGQPGAARASGTPRCCPVRRRRSARRRRSHPLRPPRSAGSPSRSAR